MKLIWLPFLVAPSILGAAVDARLLTPVDMQQARYVEVRTRIAALFDHRDTPPVEIEYADNPFLIGAVRPPSINTPVPTQVVIESADVRLRSIVDGLRISGGGQFQGEEIVFINLQPRKVGDIISVPYQGSSVLVRVDAVSPGIVTFSLEGATLNRNF